MMKSASQFVFGPVPSRRLGRSLGVDLVPIKTCTYDCIYCQCGRTTCLTVERKEWVPMDVVLNELKLRLASWPDYITLSGSGEPTLYSRLGELIEAIQVMTRIPVAVLTNGSLLWDPTVREQLKHADLVLPSLDAADARHFRAVNRPHSSIPFERLLSGLIEFRREFEGQYWLEILLVAGYNAVPADVQKLADCVKRIQPDRVQLNTVTRPPSEEFAGGVASDRLNELARLFAPRAEVIADFQHPCVAVQEPAGPAEILNLLRRRPCTVDDIARGLGCHRQEVDKQLAMLEKARLVRASRTHGQTFFKLTALEPGGKVVQIPTGATPSQSRERKS